jgi:hypothetical protein
MTCQEPGKQQWDRGLLETGNLSANFQPEGGLRFTWKQEGPKKGGMTQHGPASWPWREKPRVTFVKLLVWCTTWWVVEARWESELLLLWYKEVTGKKSGRGKTESEEDTEIWPQGEAVEEE